MSTDAQPKGAGARHQLFREILGHTQLAPNQTAVLDLLLRLDEEGASAFEPETPSDTRGRPTTASRSVDASLDSEDEGEDEDELDSLRELNDTLAAALGACRFCWGGDRECELCSGRGSPGWAGPDRRLFQELVVPAVRRVRASSRAEPRDESTSKGRTHAPTRARTQHGR